METKNIISDNSNAYEINTSKKLGEGSFGCVYEALDKDGKMVAVKILAIEYKNDKIFDSATNEYSALMKGKTHPNLIRSLDSFKDYNQNKMYLFLEYCAGGNLHDYVMKVHPDLDKKIDIMCQCADGVAFLHGLPEPIIHRDIKPANILMTEPNRNGIVKIADFGISKIMDPEKKYVTKAEGTMLYWAPEMFMGKKYTKSVDVFAMGLVFMALLRHKDGEQLVPYSDNLIKKMVRYIPVGTDMVFVHSQIEASVANKEYQVIEVKKENSKTERDLKILINQMTCFDKKDRLNMKQVHNELKRLKRFAIYSEDHFESDTEDQSTTEERLSYIPPEEPIFPFENEQFYTSPSDSAFTEF